MIAGAVALTAPTPIYPLLSEVSEKGFQKSLTKTIYNTFTGDDIPQAIGTRVKLNTDTDHTISKTKEIENEIRSHYGY